MIQIQETLNILQGALLSPRETWAKYKEENHSIQETALLVTLPMMVVSSLLTAIFAWVFSSYTMFGGHSGIMQLIFSLLMALVGMGIFTFIFSFLAGTFKGKNDMTAGFAALSLTAVPGYVGSILGTLPMIGTLLSLGLGIYSLVLLYKIIPSYLEVPQEKRVIHFIISFLVSFVLIGIVATLLGAGSAASSVVTTNTGTINPVKMEKSSGLFTSVGRQADIMDAASKDKFTAPKDGKISDAQMESLLQTLVKAAAFREEQAKKLKSLDKTVKKEEFSFADLGKMAAGMGTMMSVGNAEMEIVKTSSGNWAEYSWVKEQLRIARLQKDINDAVRHNYTLYKKYEKALDTLGF